MIAFSNSSSVIRVGCNSRLMASKTLVRRSFSSSVVICSSLPSSNHPGVDTAHPQFPDDALFIRILIAWNRPQFTCILWQCQFLARRAEPIKDYAHLTDDQFFVHAVDGFQRIQQFTTLFVSFCCAVTDDDCPIRKTNQFEQHRGERAVRTDDTSFADTLDCLYQVLYTFRIKIHRTDRKVGVSAYDNHSLSCGGGSTCDSYGT